MHSNNRDGCDRAQEVEFINVWTGLLVVLRDHFITSRWAVPTRRASTRPPTPSSPPCPTLPEASPAPTEDRASLSCRSRCSTLPRAFFGSASTAMKSTGTLCALSRLAAYLCNLCANSGLQGPFTTI